MPVLVAKQEIAVASNTLKTLVKILLIKTLGTFCLIMGKIYPMLVNNRPTSSN